MVLGGGHHFRFQCSRTSHIASEKTNLPLQSKGNIIQYHLQKICSAKKKRFIFFRSLGPQLHQTFSPCQLFGEYRFIRVGISTSTSSTPPFPSSIPFTCNESSEVGTVFSAEATWNARSGMGRPQEVYKTKHLWPMSWFGNSFHFDMRSSHNHYVWEDE